MLGIELGAVYNGTTTFNFVDSGGTATTVTNGNNSNAGQSIYTKSATGPVTAAKVAVTGLVGSDTLSGVTLNSANVPSNGSNYVTSLTGADASATTALNGNYAVNPTTSANQKLADTSTTFTGSATGGTYTPGNAALATASNAARLSPAPLGIAVSGTYTGSTTLTTAGAGTHIDIYASQDADLLGAIVAGGRGAVKGVLQPGEVQVAHRLRQEPGALPHAGDAESRAPAVGRPDVEADAVVLDERVEHAGRVRPAADARHHHLGQLAEQREALFPRFGPDHALEVANHLRERVRPDHAADDVVRVLHAAHPLAHRLVGRVLQGAAAALDREHFGPHRAHAEHVQLLAPHVLFTPNRDVEHVARLQQVLVCWIDGGSRRRRLLRDRRKRGI